MGWLGRVWLGSARACRWVLSWRAPPTLAPEINLIFEGGGDEALSPLGTPSYLTRSAAPTQLAALYPNLNRIFVTEGLGLARAYFHAYCVPSRLALLTGRPGFQVFMRLCAFEHVTCTDVACV